MHASGCTHEKTRLFWLHKIGEPPGDPKHNIGYDHDLIEVCPTCDVATLEKLRHDCFDFEDVWDQYEWYDMSQADTARLRTVISKCERPLDPFCGCAVHKSLRKSASELPTQSWNAVYEWSAHRHRVALTEHEPPRFSLLESGVGTAAVERSDVERSAVQRTGSTEPKVLVLITVVWPLTLIASLVLYFRAVDWPAFVDFLVVLAVIPGSFVAAVMLMALVSVIREGAGRTR